jgi:hypothetical protein
MQAIIIGVIIEVVEQVYPTVISMANRYVSPSLIFSILIFFRANATFRRHMADAIFHIVFNLPSTQNSFTNTTLVLREMLIINLTLFLLERMVSLFFLSFSSNLFLTLFYTVGCWKKQQWWGHSKAAVTQVMITMVVVAVTLGTYSQYYDYPRPKFHHI